VKHRLSNNVGGVKHFHAHYSMHSEKSAIALLLKMCRSNQGSLTIKHQVRNSVRPMHLFGPQPQSDYYFELLGEEERNAQSITRCWTAHHRDVRAVPRTELSDLLVIPSLAPHPEHLHR
jgi:hypothetical protein